MPQPPRNDGWKHTPKPNPAKPAANPVPNTSRKQWQPGAPRPKTTAKKTSRAFKFIAAGVGVGILTAIVVIVVLLIQPPNYTTVVVVAPDTDTLALPENAAGVNSAKGIEEWATGKQRAGLAGGRDATSARDAWKPLLEKNAANAGVVLYFAAHGGADPKGPYLWLPPKSGAVSDADKLYVDEILQRLAELPKGKPKLLVFDLAQTPANWVFGGAFADFPRALKGMAAKIEGVPELAVLCSADEGQVSWVAEERRKSAFGFYFTEGLKGAAGTPLGKLTAAGLHAYLKTEVQNWAVANRGASQEPILLPDGSGAERAGKVELATLPPEAYSEPPPAKAPKTPDLLLDEWKRAGKLAALSPAPDTTDPLKWRQYLEWLLRWERLVRLEAVPADLPKTVQGLGSDLEPRSAGGVSSRAVALPAGPALAGRLLTPAEAAKRRDDDAKRFANLWKPVTPSDHTKEWAKLPDDPEVRSAVARFVVDQVLLLGVTQETLANAEAVLTAEGSKVQPVEVHYLRMLKRHLPDDEKQWPPADLLAAAVKLRRTAEEAAWADGQVYPEQAGRWTQGLVKVADDARQLGEDELFDTKKESWARAKGRFDEADKKYAEAKERAKTVGEALAARDRVFARLPYFARWVAAARGGPAAAAALFARLEQAAKAAHAIDRLCGQLPFAPDEADLPKRLDDLKAHTAAAKQLDQVADDYTAAVKQMTAQVTESNWHALDAAQGVPFRPADPDLGQLARTVAEQLAAKTQQRTGLAPAPLNQWPAASRNLQAAAAYLDEAPLGNQMGLGDQPASNWWPQPVKLAEQLAATLRGLPAKADEATRKTTVESSQLREVNREYAEAARHARLTDPAAPAGGTPTPPDADRRYWRHYLLLKQTERITRDGWCGTNPAESNPAKWYCTAAAELVLAAADGELNALVPGRATLPTEQRVRVDRDWAAESGRKPAVLEVTADQGRVVVPGERRLRYAYRVKVVSGDRVGLPVTEYKVPDQLKAGGGGRSLEQRLEGKPAGTDVPSTPEKFDLTGREGKGTLEATVRYRGRLYAGRTDVTFAGPPNLVVENVPPTGPAVMALQAGPDATNGAVSILIDVTNSMEVNKVGEKTRLREAFDGVEKLLAVIPPGTQVVIGTFVGDGPEGKSVLSVKTVVKEFKVDGSDSQRDEVMKKVRKITAVDPSWTPIAGAIEYALNARTNKGLWPESFSGGRTLIVLTDGEDTWKRGAGGYTDRKGNEVEPGRVVQQAVTQAVADDNAPDVNVYTVLFGLGQDEDSLKAKQTAKDQFEAVGAALDNDAQVGGRGRFELFPDAKDAAKFAGLLTEAVMPRVRYRATDGKVSGVMLATSPKSLAYRPTEAIDVKPGGSTFESRSAFESRAGREQPVVQLAPGERMLIRAKRMDDGKLVLTRPAFAYELASALSDKDGDPRPNATAGKLALTLPRLEYVPRGANSTLSAVVTLEEPDAVHDQKTLKGSVRLFAWIDVANADGADFDPTMSVRVKNHLEAGGNELLAPAWDVTVAGAFKPSEDVRKFPRPKFTAYWGNGWPTPLASQNASADRVRQTQDAPAADPAVKDFTFGTGTARVLDAAVVEENGKTYLRVWLQTPADNKRVFLRAAGWKRPVGEKHSYFDRHGRYTAEFGPLSAEDVETKLNLELYAVDDLRKFAADDKRKVDLHGDPNATELRLPPRHLMNPKK